MSGWRRRGVLAGPALVLLRARLAFAGSSRSRSAGPRHGRNDKGRADLSSVRWPGRAARAGAPLTERQLLEALLIPSGNNVGPMLATGVAGSEAGFVAEMDAAARVLGMNRTVYTDPSGFDPSTFSTDAAPVLGGRGGGASRHGPPPLLAPDRASAQN